MSRENSEIAYAVLDLIRDCFEPERSVSKAIPEDISYEQFYAVSKAMGLTVMTAYALQKRGIGVPDFQMAHARSQRRELLLDAEYRKISRALSDACIQHLPLKGIVLKGLYPAVGLREMSDIDIWFDAPRTGDVNRIMTDLGYRADYYETSKHDVYTKPPMFCVEMHREIIDGDVLPKCIGYYEEQWKKLVRDAGDRRYVLTQSHEDFYIYVVVHAYKHYLIAGIGIRVLLDIYVMLQKWGDSLDMAYIADECQKLGTADFEALVRRLANRLFDRDQLDKEDRARLDEFIGAGIHGNMGRYYSNAINKSRSKRAYILSRIRTTDKQLEEHPVLSRHKALRPLYFPVRFVEAVIRRPGRLSAELKTLLHKKKDGDS